MLEFPTSDSMVVDNESFHLPDITPYLPENPDTETCAALVALYRSHCVSVIDSFRYCKERNLLKLFSAFIGTLTTPVQKLLAVHSIAPWIKECDWLMYQKMIAFVAPLTTQVVPKLVLETFSSISRRLTGHIAETMRIQPGHVSLARLEPAHAFCALLKRMLDVNQAANAAAAWLCRLENRSQMWLDYRTLVDPREMMVRANIPTCANHEMEHILKHDIRALLTPIEDLKVYWSQRFFNEPDDDYCREDLRVESAALGEEYSFPDKWVSFILRLPLAFPNHRAQCIIDKVNTLWDCILHRLTLGGAPSFSAWWMTKLFFYEMMMWQAEKGGFMSNTPSDFVQRQQLLKAKLRETVHPNSHDGNIITEQSTSSSSNGRLENGSTTNNNNPSAPEDRPLVSGDNANQHVSSDVGRKSSHHRTAAQPSANQGKLPDSQVNSNMASVHAFNNDDSAIGLDDDSMLISDGKYGDMMASDPADAEGDVVVV